ncbi:FecR family protein [Pedobacter heparinus]|uniref:FecR family protein n=1 Tax=Pedobacter heparinus TaxID=984 RepID=UPI00292D7690|nr:FecR domain-containing protein [Pedobacter heparinus]
MQEHEFKALLERYTAGKASEEEIAWLEHAYLQWNETDKLALTAEQLQAAQSLMWAVVEREAKPIRKVKLWPRVIGVAAAVAAIVFGVWFYNSDKILRGALDDKSLAYQNDIAPGKNTATLTLADGRVINLSDRKTGVVVGSELRYNDGTILSSRANAKDLLNSTNKRSLPYGRDDGQGADSKVQMLTATTPRGGMYQVVLPDGSKLWLNADSRISFPSQFIGKERKILLLYGEVYFEVAKHKKMPFIVENMAQEVTVLGTHFNISAYKDENGVKTTLLEGSVRVSSSGPTITSSSLNTPSSRANVLSSRAKAKDLDPSELGMTNELGMTKSIGTTVLKPGEQSIITNNNRITVNKIDVESAVAWKNGEFVFENEKIGSIMRKIARWYNVDVIYEGDVANKEIWGSVSKYEQVSKVLKMLAGAQTVDFEINNKTIVVKPFKRK